MNQLSLFEDDYQEISISKDVISPLESNNGVKTKEFKKQQERWSEYVQSIQDYHHCSWFEARNLLIKHRDNQEVIKTKI